MKWEMSNYEIGKRERERTTKKMNPNQSEREFFLLHFLSKRFIWRPSLFFLFWSSHNSALGFFFLIFWSKWKFQKCSEEGGGHTLLFLTPNITSYLMEWSFNWKTNKASGKSDMELKCRHNPHTAWWWSKTWKWRMIHESVTGITSNCSSLVVQETKSQTEISYNISRHNLMFVSLIPSDLFKSDAETSTKKERLPFV
jgi:hypothetical protein